MIEGRARARPPKDGGQRDLIRLSREEPAASATQRLALLGARRFVKLVKWRARRAARREMAAGDLDQTFRSFIQINILPRRP